jgi:hypothetical protein
MTAGSRSADAIRRAIDDNRAEAEGAARNARAERLAEEAERSGDRQLRIEAQFNLLTAYNYSAESDKKFVPFAKVLRMWDENPADFDQSATHSLHWYFKWVSSGMLDQPHIPLASIETWQAEMERRYRLAGYSERAVRQGEFRIARHIGDTARAERAYGAWQSAERDEMSDCHACELHLQGAWQVHRDRDQAALDSWQPVLDGELTCAHEPHAVLASSLLPLLRLGRADQARANHLRGYRLVRTMESMRAAVAQHVEFCALTGNEARGVEILAQHPGHFTATGDPDSLMDHLAATALLTARLTALGHGEQPVPGPAGREWTATALHDEARSRALDLARGFDRRNGTGAVSAGVRERIARQPLLDRLPLGVRSALPVGLPPRPAAPTEPEPAVADDDVTALVARARLLSDGGHPRAHEAWTAAERAAERTGAALDATARAEATDHAGMTAIADPERSAELFLRAARQFEDAGVPAEAAASRARAAYARALSGAVRAALDALEEQCALLRALHEKERATARQLTGVLLLRCRVLLRSATEPGHREGAFAAAGEQAAEAAALAEKHRAETGMTGRLADATVMLGRLAAGSGAAESAITLLTRAAALHHEAGQPWYAAEPESALADLCLHHGDPVGAERHALAALEHGGDILEPPQRSSLHLVATQAQAALGRDEDAAAHALDAAQWADEAGDSEGAGAVARLFYGGALRRLGRAAEGATVLESVLPDLERAHDEGEVVQARWWLAECQLDLGEAREAAEQFLLAARTAEGWADQRDHAMLANLAADALNRAGLNDEAVRAYARAESLWRAVGDPAGDPHFAMHAVVRTLRARAWIELREGRAGLSAARTLMSSALDAARQALDTAADPTAATHLRIDLADTYRQTAEILLRVSAAPTPASTEEALTLTDLAITTLTPLGPQARDDLAAATLLAAWLESDLGRPAAARARALSVAAYYADAADDDILAQDRRTEVASILDQVGEQVGE